MMTQKPEELKDVKSDRLLLMSALDNYGGHPFDDVFDIVYPVYDQEEVAIASELVKVSALVVWGGADISPTIYRQVPNQQCGATEKLSHRDKLEVDMMNRAIELGIPIIGICRGAQMACALSGGSLVQHVEKHAGGYHEIVTDEGETYSCPSLHHQMMYPWSRGDFIQPDFKMVAWCPKPRSTVYLVEPNEDGSEKDLKQLPGHEPEIVWFPETKALCIQSHPEFIQSMDNPFVKYCNKLVRQYILQ